MYQLQLNTNGAWKRVCEFDVSEAQTVRDAARVLYRIDKSGAWRIVNKRGDGQLATIARLDRTTNDAWSPNRD